MYKDCIRQIESAYGDGVFFGVEASDVEILFHDDTESDKVSDIIMIYLKTENPYDVIRAVEILESNPCIAFAEPDYYMTPDTIPDDPYYTYLWGIKKIGCPDVWDYITGSSDVIVGVTDSGINYNHPDITGNMWTDTGGHGIHGRNFENNSNDPFDVTGHGTHVAGIIGAVGNNLLGITGVCWNIKMAALKIGDAFFDVAAAVSAVDYANKNNIFILNNSWGTTLYSLSLKYAIDHYNGLFVVSSGNSGSDNDIFPVYPSSYMSKNIISVAASDQNDELASFSNYGLLSVDIAAPGAGILSTSLYSGYSYMSGTSMSAPHVTGAAALLKAYRPNLTSFEIKDIILSSADIKPQLYGKILTGGVLNVRRMFDEI